MNDNRMFRYPEAIQTASDLTGFGVKESSIAMSKGDYIIQSNTPHSARARMEEFLAALWTFTHPYKPEVIALIQNDKALVLVLRFVVRPPHPNAN